MFALDNHMSDTFTFIDLFAGCSGLARGFAPEDFFPIGSVEVDQHAAQTYAANVDREIFAVDIAEVARWPHADVIVGGPPCQGFSQLGLRNATDPRNRLWREYVRALIASQAQVFVMENVPQLLRSPHFIEFAAEVERLGFHLVKGVLNAADYGVPQKRRRAIVIGSRVGRPTYPHPTHGVSGMLVGYRTVRDAFAEPTALPSIPDGRNWHRARSGIKDYSLERYQAGPADCGNRSRI